MHEAAYSGHVEVIERIIGDKQIDKNPTENIMGWTPLHFAALEGHIEIIEKLLNHNEIVKNPIDIVGKTPFHLAASNGHIQISTTSCSYIS